MKVYGVPAGGKTVCFNDDFTLRVPSGAIYWVGLHEDIDEDSLVGMVAFPETRPLNYADGEFEFDEEIGVAKLEIKRAASIVCTAEGFRETVDEKGRNIFKNEDGDNKFSGRKILVDNNTAFALRAEVKNNLMFLGTTINLSHYVALFMTPSGVYMGTCTNADDFETRGDQMIQSMAVPNPQYGDPNASKRTIRQLNIGSEYVQVNEFKIPVPEGFAATTLIEKESHCVTIVPGKKESAAFSEHDSAPAALQFQLAVEHQIYSGDLSTPDADRAIKQFLAESVNDSSSHMEKPERLSCGSDWAVYANLRTFNSTDEVPWCVVGCYLITDQTFCPGGVVFNGNDVNPQICAREAKKWLQAIRPVSDMKGAMAQARAEASRKTFGKYAGPNGKLDAIQIAILFYKDVFFTNDSDVSFDGKHHHLNGIQMNSEVINDYSYIKDRGSDFAKGVCDLMEYVERNENLMIPKSHFHRNILQCTRGQDITGATIFDLIAWHLLIIAPENNGYLISVSVDLCNGLPNASAFIAEFIQTLRLYNGIDEDFTIRYITMRSTDAPFMPIDRPVPGFVSMNENSTVTVRKGEKPFANFSSQIKSMEPVDYQAQTAQIESKLDDEILDLFEEHAEKAAALFEEFRMKLININYGDPRMRSTDTVIDVITDMLPDDSDIPMTYSTRGFWGPMTLDIEYKVACGLYAWGPFSWELTPEITYSISQPCNPDEKNFARTFPQSLIDLLQDINKQTIYGEFIRQAGDYLASGERFIYTGSAEHLIKEINDKPDSYDLQGTQHEGRPARIEYVHVGDVVQLVHDKNNLYDRNAVEVRSERGSLGMISSYEATQLARIIDEGKVRLKAIVSMCQPLSQRSKNAKKPLIAIRITAEKKPRTPRVRTSVVQPPVNSQNTVSQSNVPGNSGTTNSGSRQRPNLTVTTVDRPQNNAVADTSNARRERVIPHLSVQNSQPASNTNVSSNVAPVAPVSQATSVASPVLVSLPSSLNQFFVERAQRIEKQAIFLRVNGYNDVIKSFVWKIHEDARKSGAIIDGKITNPDESQLRYYQDVLGNDFAISLAFLEGKLRKWVPRMNGVARSRFADGLYEELTNLQKQGKSESILKNVYIKMMCWLYYRFEQLAGNLGQAYPPKVLYVGSSLSAHELSFLHILHSLGADIVLVQSEGDSSYMKVDSDSKYSKECKEPGLGAFPSDFSLKQLRKEMINQ